MGNAYLYMKPTVNQSIIITFDASHFTLMNHNLAKISPDFKKHKLVLAVLYNVLNGITGIHRMSLRVM